MKFELGQRIRSKKNDNVYEVTGINGDKVKLLNLSTVSPTSQGDEKWMFQDDVRKNNEN